MGNNKNGDILKEIYEELEPLKPKLRKVSELVISQDVSNYPIVVMHQNAIDLGVRVPLGEETPWKINISTLEEFVKKELVEESKLKEFKEVYKDPATHICIFLISNAGANFIFYPV